jgi:hypothetical protein
MSASVSASAISNTLGHHGDDCWLNRSAEEGRFLCNLSAFLIEQVPPDALRGKHLQPWPLVSGRSQQRSLPARSAGAGQGQAVLLALRARPAAAVWLSE